MDIIFILLPLSFFLALVGLIGYLWSVKSGQFEDLDTPAMRILSEDQKIEPKCVPEAHANLKVTKRVISDT